MCGGRWWGIMWGGAVETIVETLYVTQRYVIGVDMDKPGIY